MLKYALIYETLQLLISMSRSLHSRTAVRYLKKTTVKHLVGLHDDVENGHIPSHVLLTFHCSP